MSSLITHSKKITPSGAKNVGPPKIKGFLSNGFEINEQNFVTAFSVLIIQLKLKSEGSKKKHLLPQLSKSYPYSFKVSEAVSTMRNLSLKIESDIIDNVISFSFGPDLALSLLRKYFTGHLLHDPSSRTEDNLTSHSTVQITPKGTALLYSFCKSVGMRRRDMPEAVKSNFNTMKLFQFDRSSSTRRALYSKYLNHILISEMLGPHPNVWSPEARPTAAANLYESEEPNFSIDSDHILFSGSATNTSEEKTSKTVSPFHHRYFSNPESDSHVQYYESSSGVRIFRDKVFKSEKGNVYVEYCFSGKAFVQWLCDCTTLYCENEAVEFGQLMLHYGLIVPVTKTESCELFMNHREAFYTWNESEEHVCRWSSSAKASRGVRRSSSGESEEGDPHSAKKDAFKNLLADPGMRHLFVCHLEKEKCSENMNAYLQLKEFQEMKQKYSTLVKHHKKTEDVEKRERLHVAADKMSEKSIAMASYLCSRYFSVESSCNLNIDFGLQQEIDRVIALIRGGSFPETPLSDADFAAYLKTPMVPEDMAFAFDEKDKTKNEDSSVSSSDSSHGSNEKSSLVETLATLERINRVFSNIAHSVYRMMEVDSYPKFIQSEEYMLAVETLTHRS